MTTPLNAAEFAAYQQAREAAKARAVQLRAEAIAQFWAALAQAVRRPPTRTIPLTPWKKA